MKAIHRLIFTNHVFPFCQGSLRRSGYLTIEAGEDVARHHTVLQSLSHNPVEPMANTINTPQQAWLIRFYLQRYGVCTEFFFTIKCTTFYLICDNQSCPLIFHSLHQTVCFCFHVYHQLNFNAFIHFLGHLVPNFYHSVSLADD